MVVAWNTSSPCSLERTRSRSGHGGESSFEALWALVGKWWYWGDYPAMEFAIDEIRLEPTIVRRRRDVSPRAELHWGGSSRSSRRQNRSPS